jgi:TetR/AcrR family transcriptional regulator, transcriptional repressor of bet genes
LQAATVRQVAAEAGVSVGLVQHYFSTKDEILLFALERVGEDLAARLTAKIRELPEPRDPYEVVWIVLRERLPLAAEDRVYVQALIAWLGRSASHPGPAGYVNEGTARLRDYLADQLRRGQERGVVHDRVDPGRAADGLLALADGLASHLLQGIHDPDAALAVLAEHLDHVFERPT